MAEDTEDRQPYKDSVLMHNVGSLMEEKQEAADGEENVQSVPDDGTPILYGTDHSLHMENNAMYHYSSFGYTNFSPRIFSLYVYAYLRKGYRQGSLFHKIKLFNQKRLPGSDPESFLLYE